MNHPKPCTYRHVKMVVGGVGQVAMLLENLFNIGTWLEYEALVASGLKEEFDF